MKSRLIALLGLGIMLTSSVSHARTEFSWWTVSIGKAHVIEFLSDKDRLFCDDDCYAYTVVGRPDEIFVSTFDQRILQGLRNGTVKTSYTPEAYVLDLKTGRVSLLALERFLKLEIVFEDFIVQGFEKHAELRYSGSTEGHNYVAPIQKQERLFVAALTSARKTAEKTTFGIPGFIPFWGRQKWFEKEKTHSGTFFLEIFDPQKPSTPVVQLQKEFSDMWLLPTVFKVAAWTQGAQKPMLVVVDRQNPIEDKRGRILVVRPAD